MTWRLSVTVGGPKGWKPSVSDVAPLPLAPPSTAPWLAVRALIWVLALLTLPRTWPLMARVGSRHMLLSTWADRDAKKAPGGVAVRAASVVAASETMAGAGRRVRAKAECAADSPDKKRGQEFGQRHVRSRVGMAAACGWVGG